MESGWKAQRSTKLHMFKKKIAAIVREDIQFWIRIPNFCFH